MHFSYQRQWFPGDAQPAHHYNAMRIKNHVYRFTGSQTKQATFHSGTLLQTSASINKACCQISDKKHGQMTS